ncbi:MAG: Tol-Pal system beta propeller repeat protein TolB [Pseudomonadota bacterium]|nr:Tol-Pal system beta propeller repeat protein TolB [Pseudomonadota bacterium]
MVAAAAAIFAVGLVWTTHAEAQLKVDITRGNVEPMPIAIPFFSNFSAVVGGNLGRDIANVVSADLTRSGLFRAIERNAYISEDVSLRVQPKFANWRLINAQALVVGGAEVIQKGDLQVTFRLWDVFGQQQLVGLRLTTTPGNWRQIAHRIADAIYKRITGEDGYFDTRVVYVSESGPARRRIKRLAIMDQDGANHRFLTDGKALVLTPRFSPTAQEISYLSYVAGRPRVYLFNIDTGQQEVLGDFPGMTFSPRFSPDGNKVVMSMAQEGNSEIYSMDLRTRRVRRLTRNPAIDTSPSLAPDGRRMVFNSDRGGSQQLYVMNFSGGKAKRISFGSGRYATPVWSPRGDLIAFTKIMSGEFGIGVMRPDGAGERMLATGFLVEGPTWAPNGRVLMFFRQSRRTGAQSGGVPRLYSIDLTGYNERLIGTPRDASDPAWSPLKR